MSGNRSTGEVRISRKVARRYLLIHHFLWPPRSLKRESGVRKVFDRLGSIQFDPINVTGRNPDLVLQSRIGSYRSELLDRMLYDRRELIDGWDKMACILPARDWPEFGRQRARMRSYYQSRWPQAMEIADDVLEKLQRSGPLASNEFGHHDTIEGAWGQAARVVRICLDGLYESGRVGIASRTGTRRAFDLIERLHPDGMLKREPLYCTDREYFRWHIMRRVGSLGLARDRAGVHWSGIVGVGQDQRRQTLAELQASGEILKVQIKDLAGEDFYMRTQDLVNLERARRTRVRRPRAAFLAPLDNLIWDREMIRLIFEFDYVWEVYKPQEKRKYGYYVLPILIGDSLVGRAEPRLSADGQSVEVRGWWWEPNYQPDGPALAALEIALGQFLNFLGVEKFEEKADLPPGLASGWLAAISPQ